MTLCSRETGRGEAEGGHGRGGTQAGGRLRLVAGALQSRTLHCSVSFPACGRPHTGWERPEGLGTSQHHVLGLFATGLRPCTTSRKCRVPRPAGMGTAPCSRERPARAEAGLHVAPPFIFSYRTSVPLGFRSFSAVPLSFCWNFAVMVGGGGSPTPPSSLEAPLLSSLAF